MKQIARQPEPAGRGHFLSKAWRRLLAFIYLATGLWAAWSAAWVDGNGVWRAGWPELTTPLMRGVSIALVIGWLLYGLVWWVRFARPWIWLTLGLYQFIAIVLLGWWPLAPIVGLLHVSAFDPCWLRRRQPEQPEALFYDGYCGLCHFWVKRIMHADRDGSLFFFAPLQGTTIQKMLTPAQREALPDSIVVRRLDGQVLVKSEAVVYILSALGGWYGLVAMACRLVPRSLRDLSYDCVARVRHDVFARPTQACPMVNADMQRRFEP